MSELYPLISCIMPTWNRRRFVPLALGYFLRQDYAGPLELLVIDDGDDPVGDLVQAAAERAPAGRSIRYLHLIGRHAIGQKMNYGIGVAQGDLLAMWADDDWHAPWRISRQAETLQANGLEVCGTDRCLFWDLRRDVAARYSYLPDGRPQRTPVYLVGGTLLFTRAFWLERPYEPINLGEDNEFIAGRLPGRAGNVEPDIYCAMIHGENTSATRIAEGHEQFQAVDLEELAAILGDDYGLYDGLRANRSYQNEGCFGGPQHDTVTVTHG